MNLSVINNLAQITSKAILILLSLLLTIPSRSQDIKDDNKQYSGIILTYQMYSGIEVKKNIDDQLKSLTILPNSIDVTDNVVKKGIETFTSNLSMKLEKFSSNIFINGKTQEASRYQVTLSSVVKDVPYYNAIKCEAKWNSVINKKGVNILKMSENEMAKESVKAITFSRYSQGIFIQYKEGDADVSEVHGKIKMQIPKYFNLLKLSDRDVGVENTLGSAKIKLISMDHNVFKILITGDDKDIKIMCINKDDKEFSKNIVLTIPLAEFTEFEKKKKISNDDLDELSKTITVDPNEKVKIGDVSGIISKIYIYKAFDTAIKEVSVDLKN